MMNVEEKQNIVNQYIEVMVNNVEAKPKKKDTRVRNRKEYMKRYYTQNRDVLLDRRNYRYTPTKSPIAKLFE